MSGGGAVLADVVLDGEKVAAVGLPEEMELLAGADAEVVDVSGCCCFRDLLTLIPILTCMWRGR